MTPQQEESAAKARLRRMERARRAAAANRNRQAAIRTREVVRETGRRYTECRCEFHGRLDHETLVRMGSGCTTHYVCPRLDTVRRRLG
jgi:hypothetical protein